MIYAKYGTPLVVPPFPLIKAGSNNFALSTDYITTAGYVQISKDSGAATTATNALTFMASGYGGLWELTLTTAEMQAQTIVVTVCTVRTTQTVEDQALMIGTYGDTTAALISLTDFSNNYLKRNLSEVTGEAARSPLNAIRPILNKWTVSGTTLTVYKEDDATSAWTSAITTSGTVAPITSSDPN